MQDDERAHYRETLLKLRRRLTDELHKAVDRVADKASSPDELCHVPTHAADRDSEGLDRDIAVQANREEMLAAIECALGRVDDGSFGCCEDCGADIPRTRLDVLPFASRCVKCEEKREDR
jgi:RNA polymerase-binding protein DksA